MDFLSKFIRTRHRSKGRLDPFQTLTEPGKEGTMAIQIRHLNSFYDVLLLQLAYLVHV